MKAWYCIVMLLLLFLFIPHVSEASGTLQSKINQAPSGSTIEIEKGEYTENITISKPLTLVGDGNVLIQSCEEKKPVIMIKGKNVTLKNVNVAYCGDQKDDTAIFVTGSNHVLKGLNIKTKRFGVRLDQATHVLVEDNKVNGFLKGNGIDLWNSNENTLKNLQIASVFDGIYLEQSSNNQIFKNTIQDSRYGIHLMYAHENDIEKNKSKYNITGSMIMSSNRNVVKDNTFSANNVNVNAQGLLLYDTSDIEIIRNEFLSNRLGVFVENSEKSKIHSNKFVDNFIGIQFKKAKQNTATYNTFAGNVTASQAIESSNNQFIHNYWDEAGKVDMDGDGASNIPFSADPYFLVLTSDVPEYQLFFQTPGLILLQNMLRSPTDQLLMDSSPLMDVTMEVEKKVSSPYLLWGISGVMILISCLLFQLGRRRR